MSGSGFGQFIFGVSPFGAGVSSFGPGQAFVRQRTYGVVIAEDGTKTWVEVTTDANGRNDAVMLTTLCQVLLLNRGESPIYGSYGVPSLAALQNQVPPDLYVAQTQAQFAPFFAALTVARQSASDGLPIYNIAAVTNNGAILTVYNGQPVIPQ